MPLETKLHHSQFPAIPLAATMPVTASGVSAAKVVATMEVPGQPPRHVAAGEEEFVDARLRARLVIEADGEVEQEVEPDHGPVGEGELHSEGLYDALVQRRGRRIACTTAMAITQNLRWVIFLSAASCMWAADARNGEMVLEQQGCQQCHPVRGQGLGHETPQVARDLGARLAPTYGPHSLASDAVEPHPGHVGRTFGAAACTPPAATESDWQDLFAYFYSLQFFEPPAEVGRGKKVLESKRCTDCHSLSKTPTGRGPSVADWAHMDDPVVLVYQMWNHASTMKNTFARNKIAWKTLTGRDLVDLTAYVQNVQSAGSEPPVLAARAGNRQAVVRRELRPVPPGLQLAGDEASEQDLDGHRRGYLESSQKMPTVRMVGPDDMRENPGVCLATAV